MERFTRTSTNTEVMAGRPAIFVFTTAYHPFIGGAEVAVSEVTKRLQGEYRFFIFTSRFRKDLPRRESQGDITIRRIGFGFSFDKFLVPFLGFFVVWREMRRERPILFWAVMVSYASGIPYLINLFCPYRQIPLVLTLQEGDSVSHIRKSRFCLVDLAWRLALRHAYYLTAISTFLLRLGREFGYRGEGKVIPNGVDVSAFEKEFSAPDLAGLRNGLGIKADEKVVVTTSRLVEKNAVDVAIRAIAILVERGVKVKFLVLGSGGEEGKLKTLVEQEGVGQCVIFLGDVPHAEIPKYLKLSDVFIRPSRSEGLGNSFIEAMAAGVPIIGTMVGGIPDFLEDGRTGFVVRVDDPVDSAEKIKMLFENDGLRLRIREEGKKAATGRFQWGAIAEAYGKVFRRTAEDRKKIRLLIATGIFPPDIGGPATYSKLLLDEFPGRGFQVEVLSFGSVRHLSKGIRHLIYCLKLMRRALRADIIFGQDPVSVGLPAVIVATLLCKPFVLKVVGDYAWEQYQQKVQSSKFKVQGEKAVFKNLDEFQNGKFDFITELRRKIQKFVARRAEKIIVPSEYLKKIVHVWGVSVDKISVVYNAVDAANSLLSRDAARRQLGFSGHIAVSVGRLVPWKGFAALIECVSEIRKRIPDFQLFIIGSGPDFESLKSKVKSLKLESCVHLTGGVSQDDVLAYFAAADVFILNTAYEGFSHTLLEAMAAGVPVITTPVGGNREVVKDEENGLLVAYNSVEDMVDAVQRVFGDEALRKRLSVSARLTASQFTKEKMLGETTAILKGMVRK